MSQLTLIILCALAMGVSAAFATWLSIDVAGGVGTYLSERRKRKRLEAESRALQEAEAEGTKKNDKA